MRVLMTHEAFAPDFAGGGEYILLETARGLLRRGVDLTVLTTGDPRIASYEGIRTVRLPIGKFRMNLAVSRIAKLAREADVIQTSTFHAAVPSLLAGKLAGKPVVCQVLGLFQDAWKEMHPGLGGRLRIVWERHVVRRKFARLVFLSDYSRELGIQLGARPESAVTNCPGIAPGAFRPAIPKEPSVLFAGKLDVRKGIRQVLQVARAFPATPFRVMGWGPDEAMLRREAPPNVEFLGFLTGAALASAYGRALVCLLPSKAETFGLTVIEAMASGCAVVSSIPLPFAGVRTGPEDVPAMIAAVGSLLADPARAAELGRRNAGAAGEYTWERHLDRLLEIYCDVLGRPAAQPVPAAPREAAALGGKHA
jgi:glycosyltransferase involved in cell wall biosynthesis